MVTKKYDELHDLVKSILVAAGADKPNAEIVAEHLVLANLSGVDSHGIWHVLGYVDAINDGSILPTQSPTVLKQTPSSALVSGNWTFGQVACKFATELAIEKAKAQDIAIVGLVQKHHIGRLGHYCEMAAGQGLIGLIVSGGQGQLEPATMPYGGTKPILHTNPIASGFPTKTAGHPMMFDFATSWTSGVKVHNASKRGEKLPHGYIVDKHGKPTDDPEKFFDGGGHAPFGGHKGYAIMMLVEYLGRIFTGANEHADDRRGGPVLRNAGTTLIAIKADLFQDMASYNGLAGELGDQIRSNPPAEGFSRVLVPGDPEFNTREERKRVGIPIEDDIWQTIVQAAQKVGVTV